MKKSERQKLSPVRIMNLEQRIKVIIINFIYGVSMVFILGKLCHPITKYYNMILRYRT